MIFNQRHINLITITFNNKGDDEVNFCDSCGRPLDKKVNKHFEGPDVLGRKYCNQKCKAKKERINRPRAARRNHGVVKLKVFIACEFSGIVRDAFAKRGHDAWSCDLLPTERTGQHIQGDVLKYLDDGWDLMIAHPPCTYLSYAAARYWNTPGRAEKRETAMRFFMNLANASIKKICIENPVGYPSKAFRKYDQIINPFQFGHPERKRTCLWLKNLPLLIPTKIVEPEKPHSIDKTTGHKRYFTDGTHRNPKNRSLTFQGIADAMAEQWGGDETWNHL